MIKAKSYSRTLALALTLLYLALTRCESAAQRPSRSGKRWPHPPLPASDQFCVNLDRELLQIETLRGVKVIRVLFARDLSKTTGKPGLVEDLETKPGRRPRYRRNPRTHRQCPDHKTADIRSPDCRHNRSPNGPARCERSRCALGASRCESRK
jgi:hypothetical protein